jgi:short-subunit dehydrogenase involved in D-alanine esterification of teichoic acids
MRALITGHTAGIGKAIYERFDELGFHVQGVARSTGFDIEYQYNEILNWAQNCDIFVNNVYCKDYQTRFLRDLQGKVPYIISLGSAAGYYQDKAASKKEYCVNKSELIETTKKLSFHTTSHLLTLNVAMTENSTTDPGCRYKDILNICEIWLTNPCFHSIDFNLKLTETNQQLILAEFGVSKEELI